MSYVWPRLIVVALAIATTTTSCFLVARCVGMEITSTTEKRAHRAEIREKAAEYACLGHGEVLYVDPRATRANNSHAVTCDDGYQTEVW